MKKFILLISFLAMILMVSCTAQQQYERERYEAKYTTQYAKSVNDLEKAEGNFKVYRRVIFYNVRLGETVFACEKAFIVTDNAITNIKTANAIFKASIALSIKMPSILVNSYIFM